ncbi:LacI family DNA-binding transcriptional regulator [Actinophytocola oryzae]|uniref:LacI family transcriptional regulator n=1 Tax=Actinophytocola oryzae TaxID=502181 RepID=A0A4V3FQV1_9PSEU|nr:LacI family DNA-binding transcriptional regulator [Actinophytocola oryzae]TDV41111.1 LacI family transcriptional regulator [Actinophytocola oryzae]
MAGRTTGRTPTLEDVARVAGVSRATVSRVVNGIRNVDQDIQEAVRRAIEKTGYAPNRAARSLVTRRAGAVALVVSGAGGHVFGDPFFGRVADGVVDFLRGHGVHPLLMLADTDAARDDILAHLREGGTDGALLVSTHPDDLLTSMVAVAGLPAVVFARTLQRLSYVDVENEVGGALAARHLLSRGCRNLATISGPLDVRTSNERLAGFRVEAGETPTVAGNFTVASGEEAMTTLLAGHPNVDGVFAANDLMAQGALAVLQSTGRSVPTDVAVVGFDDSSAALACRPKLTTVRQPVEDMGAAMAELLLARIQDPSLPPASRIFEPQLVIRDSA